ncbi:hypothetical protein [Arthrobacter alpinus]|uniref:hypothetical protein n=1 Tax=Arthrobacter alpinus TaxID=656366 RepID=UPI00078237C7|nr:hypothetical protein [Arthrobacter alpinus]
MCLDDDTQAILRGRGRMELFLRLKDVHGMVDVKGRHGPGRQVCGEAAVKEDFTGHLYLGASTGD